MLVILYLHFLPCRGLDSSSCTKIVNLLKRLAQEGKTIICTIHQPSASLFELFDQVYVLAKGSCLYQGATNKLVPYLEDMQMPCPMYHNPADYIIELACGDHGEDKIDILKTGSQNGSKNFQSFDNPEAPRDDESLTELYSLKNSHMKKNGDLHATNFLHQIKVLLRRGFIMSKRNTTLTHMRIGVNILVGLMLGSVFWQSGADGSRVLDNYKLLFSILIHHMMTTMMLTIVTFPMQIAILLKEHFNRWYSLKAFYMAMTLIDMPISILCCTLFSVIVYGMSAQPLEIIRFSMFFIISLLIMFIGQSTGLMIGAVFNVVNGTFIGPTLAVALMMFSGFGILLRDLPSYLKWGSYVSYLRYGLEGFIDAIYGLNRPVLPCEELYCHYRYPTKFLSDIDMKEGQFWNDVMALTAILIITRCCTYLLLRWKIVWTR
ncbi:ATP-binding cassette sub-family G member 4 [Ooceraea biroi]|nr:ATP-binding cassette sub-family G member 4 [Ooceraea biroi]